MGDGYGNQFAPGCCNCGGAPPRAIQVTIEQPCPSTPGRLGRLVPYLISSCVGPDGVQHVTDSPGVSSLLFSGTAGDYRVTVIGNPAATVANPPETTYSFAGPVVTTITVPAGGLAYSVAVPGPALLAVIEYPVFNLMGFVNGPSNAYYNNFTWQIQGDFAANGSISLPADGSGLNPGTANFTVSCTFNDPFSIKRESICISHPSGPGDPGFFGCTRFEYDYCDGFDFDGYIAIYLGTPPGCSTCQPSGGYGGYGSSGTTASGGMVDQTGAGMTNQSGAMRVSNS